MSGALAACSESGTGPNPPATELTILGSVMSGNYQNLTVTRGTDPSNATVAVNGHSIPAVGGGGFYGQLPAPVADGGQLTLVVVDDDLEATGLALVPATPTITGVTGTAAGGEITVQWTSAADPDSFVVALNYRVDGAGHAQRFMATGSARQRNFTPATPPAGASNFSVGVHAFNAGSFTGDATSDSRMNVRSSSLSEPID
jgi:hypothetical protein